MPSLGYYAKKDKEGRIEVPSLSINRNLTALIMADAKIPPGYY